LPLGALRIRRVCGGEMKRGVPDPDDRRSCQAIPAFEDIELPVKYLQTTFCSSQYHGQWKYSNAINIKNIYFKLEHWSNYGSMKINIWTFKGFKVSRCIFKLIIWFMKINICIFRGYKVSCYIFKLNIWIKVENIRYVVIHIFFKDFMSCLKIFKYNILIFSIKLIKHINELKTKRKIYCFPYLFQLSTFESRLKYFLACHIC